jgi:hypothetical protein
MGTRQDMVAAGLLGLSVAAGLLGAAQRERQLTGLPVTGTVAAVAAVAGAIRHPALILAATALPACLALQLSSGDAMSNEKQEEYRHKQLADEAADAAVKKVFAILGVDIDSPKEVAEFQATLRFSSTIHKAASAGALAVVGLVCTGAYTWAKDRLQL